MNTNDVDQLAAPISAAQALELFESHAAMQRDVVAALAVLARQLRPKEPLARRDFVRNIRKCISRTPPDREILRALLQAMIR